MPLIVGNELGMLQCCYCFVKQISHGHRPTDPWLYFKVCVILEHLDHLGFGHTFADTIDQKLGRAYAHDPLTGDHPRLIFKSPGEGEMRRDLTLNKTIMLLKQTSPPWRPSLPLFLVWENPLLPAKSYLHPFSGRVGTSIGAS